MKFLLQHVDNRLFFQSEQTWAPDPETAFDFQNSQAILQFVKARGLAEVQLVLKIDHPPRYEAFPIAAAR